MDFYKYKVEDIKKEIINFSKGTYGNTIFLLAYSPTLIIIAIAIIMAIFETTYEEWITLEQILPIIIIVAIFSFILGNVYYYKELRKYMENKEIIKILKDANSPVKNSRNLEGKDSKKTKTKASK